ncbi:hypothetical protein [Halodesulfovibrio marinisediminis]|uniref:Uncharacterized protein n=1 Tax=Halodesulfovibrio marinisediminis DSM 17456 TaxID=1121457 RepID=A0A1N6J5Y4_9BACT|nr:hypothetical protein [Halodesulfovibrio marinisediminis]SIO39720.1 hypothetical protein SAMN02745161_3188 [Halodesulfovibrio marinisediminis DSM 17456]
MNSVFKRLVFAFLCVSLFALTAQAGTNTADKTVGYGSYAVTIPTDFQEVGQTSVSIPLNTEVTGRLPHGSMHSKVFTNGETILFVQRMLVPVANTSLKPLEGSRVVKWGKGWRKNAYSVNGANTTREFAQYINFIKEQGVSASSEYAVEMYDYLVSPTGLNRVLAFTPKKAEGLPSVPESIALYAVENNK